MRSTLIGAIGKKLVVKLEKAGRVEWLTCHDYDESKPKGSKWSSASFFDSFEEAVNDATESEPLYLLTIQPDYDDSNVEYTVVKGRDMAIKYLRYIKEYISEENIADKIEELRDLDLVSFGEYGYIRVENFVFGSKIGEEF